MPEKVVEKLPGQLEDRGQHGPAGPLLQQHDGPVQRLDGPLPGVQLLLGVLGHAVGDRPDLVDQRGQQCSIHDAGRAPGDGREGLADRVLPLLVNQRRQAVL